MNAQFSQTLELLKKSTFRSKFKLSKSENRRQTNTDERSSCFHCATCHRHLLPGLYSEVASDKERKGAFGSGDTVSRRIDHGMDCRANRYR